MRSTWCGPDTETAGASRRGRAAVPALLAGGLLAAALLGEGLVRALDLGPSFQIVFTEVFRASSDPVLEYELRPGARDGAHRINAAGFRDRAFAPTPAPDHFRIVALGDSVTYGLGVRREDAYPKRLERLLDRCAGADGLRFETLNLGVPGYNVTQVVERLRGLGLREHPDLVLYGYVLNDPQSFSLEASALHALEEHAERRLRDTVRRESGRLLAHSHLFLLARQAWAQLGAEPEFCDLDREGALRVRADGRTLDVDPGLDPGHRAWALRGDRRGRWFRRLHRSPRSRARLEAGLDALARIARSRVPVAVAVFPLFVEPRAGPYPLADVDAAVLAAAEARGLPARDLAPAFVGAARRLGPDVAAADFVHPNAFGHDLAAHAIARWLVGARLVPAAPAAAACLATAEAENPRIARALGAPAPPVSSAARPPVSPVTRPPVFSAARSGAPGSPGR